MAKTKVMVSRENLLKRYLAGEVSRKEAAFVLQISPRQFARVVNRFREHGVEGLKHRNIGHKALNRTPEEITSRIIQLMREKYQGAQLLAAHRMLKEQDQVQISYSTLRRICIESGVFSPKGTAYLMAKSELQTGVELG